MHLVGDYTIERMKIIHDEWWRKDRENAHYANPVFPEPEDVQVIINGHRYNLS